MGWLYGVPAATRSLMSWRGYTYMPQRSSKAWISTHPPIRSKPKASGPLLKIYECRLLMLTQNCVYNFSHVPIMKLFTKYVASGLGKSTCFKAVPLWNSLDNHTHTISSKSLFYNFLKRQFIFLNAIGDFHANLNY